MDKKLQEKILNIKNNATEIGIAENYLKENFECLIEEEIIKKPYIPECIEPLIETFKALYQTDSNMVRRVREAEYHKEGLYGMPDGIGGGIYFSISPSLTDNTVGINITSRINGEDEQNFRAFYDGENDKLYVTSTYDKGITNYHLHGTRNMINEYIDKIEKEIENKTKGIKGSVEQVSQYLKDKEEEEREID